MSLISVILLLAAGTALAALVAALRAARGLRTDVAALRQELARSVAMTPPTAPLPDEELIRAAVADALADERERELAEARAFWAEQEAREAADPGLIGPAPVTGADEAILDALLERYLSGEDLGIEPEDLEAVTGPGHDGREPGTDTAADAPSDDSDHPGDAGVTADERTFVPRQGTEPATAGEVHDEDGVWAAEVAAARRRHPSHPGYSLTGDPLHRASERGATAEERHRTGELLTSLAEASVPLADVRPGPLGTLDVLLFEDGTTLCLSPGHRATAERLATSLRAGVPPVLLGGSGVCGAAYALTFGCGDDSVYLLADRIVTA